MIRPPTELGVLFSDATDGDLRRDQTARIRVSDGADVDDRWATVNQVHGGDVVRVQAGGPAGDADAIWTTVPRLGVAVFTADCLGVVVHAAGAVGVAHAGWRGVIADVVPNLLDVMADHGHPASSVWVGPGIGSCCFEVGSEVSAQFAPEQRMSTTWGTESVDLNSALRSQVGDVPIWTAEACTRHEDAWFSHRRDGTTDRMVALGWLK